MTKKVEKIVEKQPDPAIRSGGNVLRHIARHIDAVGQFARIVEVPVVGKPDLSGFEDALETAHVGVMIKSLRNRAVGLLGQQMLARPVLEFLDRLLKLLGQWHMARIGSIGFGHRIAVKLLA